MLTVADNDRSFQIANVLTNKYSIVQGGRDRVFQVDADCTTTVFSLDAGETPTLLARISKV